MTLDCLIYMRDEVGRILDEGGSLIDAYKIDQRAYRHLDTFDELAGLNADRIYRAMEFERVLNVYGLIWMPPYCQLISSDERWV